MGRLADRPGARARLRRRGFPIHSYVGPNGTGKSAIMVYDTLPSLEGGRPVLSTVRLLDYHNPRPCPGYEFCDDPANHEQERMAYDLRPAKDLDAWLADWTDTDRARFGQLDDDALLNAYRSHVPVLRTALGTGLFDVHQAAHPLYVRFTDYSQLLSWRDGDVLMDEVTGVCSSRESGSMPVQVANYLVQLRRRNVALRWSCPAWGRADIIIREVSQAVTLMSAAIPKKAPPTNDGTPRLWSQRRGFLARTYDPSAVDEFEAHRADDAGAMVTAFYWGPRSKMFTAYSTLDAVSSLGWANEAGLCMQCGGKRTHPKCACGTDHKAAPGARPGRREPKAEPDGPLPGAAEPQPAGWAA